MNEIVEYQPPLRFFIDLDPPLKMDVEIGDVWIRWGEWRVWTVDGWDPPWDGKRRKTKRKNIDYRNLLPRIGRPLLPSE